MTKSIHSFILLALFAPLACDDDTSLAALSVDVDDPVASVDAAQPAGARSRAFEIHEDGESLEDRIVAVVEADAETTIYFSRGDADVDGHFPVDVTILGRDGGFDYGGLVTSQQATPLELYLAVAADDAPVPEALQRAHDWQIAAEGRPALAPRPSRSPVPTRWRPSRTSSTPTRATSRACRGPTSRATWAPASPARPVECRSSARRPARRRSTIRTPVLGTRTATSTWSRATTSPAAAPATMT
ncbi:hypothetical protein OV079_02215 [Nannocystis pusilla]|uniref:Uncharacterized protein n=1 Tax=Nannocystis pusilla TaxID=889268 RepID=A0A9X3EIM6_9BACT|nr:hypothetical protein [Nannocystis pusilla]MCY1004400.1 hypothetical protein [Nannocystis pusilla]